MNAFRLALRVLRGDRRTRMSAILTAAGVAVATALTLLLVSLPGATDARTDRIAWQQPAYGTAQEDATLALAADKDYYQGRRIVRVDVAALVDPARITLPDGVDRLPGPGEVLFSPELAELVADTPGPELGDRYGREVVGTLGPGALTDPGQLVAVVGHAATDLPPSLSMAGQDGFATSVLAPDVTLDVLAGVGVVVLVVPSLVLVASAARLTAARREARLAALRLAGASPGQVVATVAGEMAIAAVGGALVGLALSPPLHALARYVPWDGDTWQAGDFALPVTVSVPVVLTIPVLVLLSAVLGLRRVVRAPLGAANRHARGRPHWWRLLSVPVTLGGFFLVVTNADGPGWLPVLFASLAAVLASAALVGPWVTAAVGSLFVRFWRGAPALLAGRRLRDDPKGAYRASAGVVLAVFTGSMALTLLASAGTLTGSSSPFAASALYTSTRSVDEAEEIAAGTEETLRRSGSDGRALTVPVVLFDDGTRRWEAFVLDCAGARQALRVDVGTCAGGAPGVAAPDDLDPAAVGVLAERPAGGTGLGGPVEQDGDATVPLDPDTPVYDLPDTRGIAVPALVHPDVLPETAADQAAYVVLTPAPGDRELARTALAGAAGAAGVDSVRARVADQRMQLADLRRVTVLGLVAAAVLSGCSAAIATAGSVFDRRRTFGALLAAGTPVRTLGTALRTEAAMPALVATTGAGTVGVAVGIGLFDLVRPADAAVLTPWVAAPVVLGVLAAVLAASVCGPALKRIGAEPLSDE